MHFGHFSSIPLQIAYWSYHTIFLSRTSNLKTCIATEGQRNVNVIRPNYGDNCTIQSDINILGSSCSQKQCSVHCEGSYGHAQILIIYLYMFIVVRFFSVFCSLSSAWCRNTNDFESVRRHESLSPKKLKLTNLSLKNDTLSEESPAASYWKYEWAIQHLFAGVGAHFGL